jgi:hypothetical protein
MIKCPSKLSIQETAGKVVVMNVNSPDPEERKRLLQAFHDLPQKDKEIMYSAVEHLRWLTMLWDMEKPNPESMPSTSEKRHILLAYKLLQIIWFSKLPETDHLPFTVYVRDRLPDDQDPQTVNDIFATHKDELAGRCESLGRPTWLAKETKAIRVSLDSFPFQVP